MDLRLPGPASSDRRFGRRAGDAAPAHSAPFVAQVAGLSLKTETSGGGYAHKPAQAPTGLVADARA